ncbi:MAG: helix-turn-helix domain-containing protein [Phycisphaerales bacterium]|nr:MAG: helix-turn-helix domain-containing protein [Phycisphaerales bacterium]
MAGMFYSLEETAKRLNKTEEQVTELAKEGKLREFRDGPNLLFKVDEVEALMSDTTLAAAKEAEPTVEQPTDLEQPVELEQPAEPVEVTEPEEPVELEPSAEPVAAAEPEQAPELEEPAELEPPAVPTGEIEPPEEVTPEPSIEFEPTAEPAEATDSSLIPEMELPAESDQIAKTEGTPEPEELPEPEFEVEDVGIDEDEISLVPETGIAAGETDLTNMDTALTGEGISVLGETDKDYAVTDDSMSETVGPTGTTSEASLEEIEGDVNLDSFGSGSGLLDLSLQADDTSLGGILDEIYTTEGGQEGQEPAEPEPDAGMAAEAEQIIPEEDLAAPQVVPDVRVMPRAMVEVAPDTQSNTFGILLFLPLLVLLYTAIVTIAAQRGVIPSILTSVQGVIWYIMIGAVVVAGLVVGAAFMLGGDFAKAGKKEKKPKKPKKPKKAKKGKELPPAPEEDI